VYPHSGAVELLTDRGVREGDSVVLPAWGVKVMEERPGGGWEDIEGNYINAHGAGVMFHDGVYYLYGEIKKGKTRLVPGQNWEDYRVDAGGVSCYSSRDLVHWNNEGVALATDRADTASDLYIGRVIERPKVIYNSRTRQYVMWMHIDRDDYGYARAGVAVSERPQGPFRYLGSVRPNGQMSRDMTVFQDGDGRAYLIYSSEGNATMQVCLLSADYLSLTPMYKRILIGQNREAPAVFHAGGKYYLITSLCSGWDPNAARVAVADSMLGEWVQEGNPCVGEDSATTFLSQSTYVLPLGGDRFLFMADRWNKTNLQRSGYLWVPFSVRGGRIEIREEDTAAMEIGPGLVEGPSRAAIGPLALVDYTMKLQVSGKGKGGHSFIRSYDSSDRLLLEYTVPVSDTGKYVEAGDYIETPAGTAYVVIGAGQDPPGKLSMKEWKIETNIGETLLPHAPLCDLRQYLEPFWKGDTVYNETVLLYSAVGAPAEGRLLYEPGRVLSVRNFGLDTVFQEGVDYRLEGRRMVRLAGSRMPFRADSSFGRAKDLAWYNLQSQWVVVTYTHHDKWAGPVPGYKGDRLPRVTARLREGKPVTIVAYGMSITRGFNVSGYDWVAPFMPTYLDLFADGLRWRYPRADVRLYNAGLPGSTVSWGAKYVSNYVNPFQPDLVVIDFGMNDFWRMPPAEFGDSVRSIIRHVRAAWPAAEFLLLANMIFDPDYVLDSDSNKAFYTGNLAGYRDVLREMEGPGVVMLDMTTLSDAIYRRKKAKDCIVNPLHPNDYLARWYAQGMIALLVR
jgi:lysophospholipase L1-like esterase